jgi:hypothetical protein
LFNGRDARTCSAVREDIVSLSPDHSPERPLGQGLAGDS